MAGLLDGLPSFDWIEPENLYRGGSLAGGQSGRQGALSGNFARYTDKRQNPFGKNELMADPRLAGWEANSGMSSIGKPGYTRGRERMSTAGFNALRNQVSNSRSDLFSKGYDRQSFQALRGQKNGGLLWDEGSMKYVDPKAGWNGSQLDPNGQYFETWDTDKRAGQGGKRDMLKTLYQNINGKATPVNAVERDELGSWKGTWLPALGKVATVVGAAYGISSLGNAMAGTAASSAGAGAGASGAGAMSFPVYSPALPIGTELGALGAAGAAGGGAGAALAGGGATSFPVYSPAMPVGSALGPASGGGLLGMMNSLPPGTGRLASTALGAISGGAGAGSQGSPGGEYTGPIAPVNRGAWQPSVGYTPQPIDRPDLTLPQTGEENDGLWRYMQDNPIALRGLLDDPQALQRAGLFATPTRKQSL